MKGKSFTNAKPLSESESQRLNAICRAGKFDWIVLIVLTFVLIVLTFVLTVLTFALIVLTFALTVLTFALIVLTFALIDLRIQFLQFSPIDLITQVINYLCWNILIVLTVDNIRFFFSFTCRFVDSLQELSADDQKFLTDNRYRYQKTHPLALAKYLLILNWGGRFKVEECLDLMSDWAPMTPLVRSQCHADILLICETRKRK